jgi:hypothetical protein
MFLISYNFKCIIKKNYKLCSSVNFILNNANFFYKKNLDAVISF